jgi:hypothetical protein
MTSAANITRTVESTPHGGAKVVKTGGAPAAKPSPSGRPTEVRTLVHGSVTGESKGPREDGIARQARHVESTTALPDRVRAMLASVDKHGDFRDVKAPSEASAPSGDGGGDAAGSDAPSGEESGGGAPAADDAPAGGDIPAATPTPTPDKPKEAPAAEPAKPAATAQPDPELSARAERLAEHNKRLIGELEQLRTKGPSEPDERTKTLHDIERNLSSDFVGSMRKLMALHAGLKEDSPDLDQLMAGGYSEWTAKELKMQLDPAQRADIGTRRNTLLIERDKRERDANEKAAKERAAAEAEAQRNADYARQLDAHLETVKHGEKYPLMMALSQDLDGMSPGALLRVLVQRGTAAGEVSKDMTGDKLTEHYSKQIEAHYQKHLDKIKAVMAKARPAAAATQTSTATTTQASASATDNKAGATNQGARTITNASASVAPATPPAATPTATPTDNGPPKRKPNESESSFRKRAAAHFFPDS